MSAASEWVDGLSAEVREFSRTQGTPIVEVHLLDGAVLKVQQIRPGPGESFVSLSVYPDATPGDAVLEAMVKDREGDYHAARVVIVNLHQIRRVELRHDALSARTLGFLAPSE